MTEPDVRKYRAYFESEVAGRGAIGFIGGSKGAKWMPFREANRDMQFLEWQIYLVRKMCVVMGLTPQDLGLTFDINKSTAETQIQISEDRGLRPLMSLLQDYLTQEIIWDPAFGGPENNLCFRFTALNLKESTAKALINEKALAGVPWRYINEARVEEGREPIPGMEKKLIMETPQGALDISDVPTVREFLEMQQAAKKPPPPAAPPPKAADINVQAMDLSPITELAKGYSADQLEIIKEALARMTPPNLQISEGAIQVPVTVENIDTKRVENYDVRPSTTVRNTEFTVDDTGRIVGKHETESIEVKAVDPTEPRRIVRETSFVTDEKGRVVGKKETESDAD